MVKNKLKNTRKKFYIFLGLFACTVFSLAAYQDPQKRDVPYSPEITLFRDKGNNNEVTNTSYRQTLYVNAIKAAQKEQSNYKKYVQLARCEYLGGMAELWGIPDFSESPKISDKLKKIIAIHFDKGLSYLDIAAKTKKGSDWYTIHAELLTSNSMVKPLSYVTLHGKELLNSLNKAVTTDPYNGECAYIQALEHFYAPFPLGNRKKGYKQLIEILNNNKMIFEQADIYQIYANLANQYTKDKEYKIANKWNKKALAIYPQNPTQLKTQTLINENIK